jgi:CO/xanthine dehydrogenase Mo-binding subunit
MTFEEKSVKVVPTEGAALKVTGSCEYTSDIQLPGMLVVKALYPEYPRAKITKLDTSAAEALAGVGAVVTYHDLPDKTHYGILTKDQQIFAMDEVFYIGDIIALVAAETSEIAEQAVELLKVEYEPLEGVYDPVKAFQSSDILARSDIETNILDHVSVTHGDVKRGFDEADVIIKKSYSTQCMEQLFLETESVVADWDGENLVMYVSGQDPHGDRNQVADALGLPISKVQVIYPYVGGGFGGKEEMHIQIQTAVLAMKAKCPVKFVRSRQESLFTHQKRGAIHVYLETGAKKDGTLTAIRAKVIGDSGPYANIFPAVIGGTAELISGPYKIPNAQIDSYAVATNNLIAGGMRGFGTPEVAWAFEQNIDLIAEELGIDPVEFRLKNGMEKGTLMPSGAYIYHEIGLKKTIEEAAAAASWMERDQWLDREPAPGLKRGLGVATIWHGMGMGKGVVDHSGAVVEMVPDGSVILYTGSSEMGQGAITAQKIIISEDLGVPLDRIEAIVADTNAVPAAGTTSASRSTYMMGNAILKATNEIKDNLSVLASKQLEAKSEDLVYQDNKVWAKDNPDYTIDLPALAGQAWWENIQLRAEGFVEMWHPEEPVHELNFRHAHSIFAYATHIAQVLVDTGTGQVKVEKIWAAHDVGKAINRQAIEGQIDGGIAQGIGYALTEELQQKDGYLLNDSLSTYIAPVSTDMPDIQPIIIEVPQPSAPNGAIGIGEPTLVPVAPAIANAIADAIGVRMPSIPMTPERVLEEISKQKK